MPIVPADIWIHISRFIPDQDLSDMLTVNSAFFESAMDAKYRRVLFFSFRDVEIALKRMRRLRDPAVAHRVRDLRVHLVSSDVNSCNSWTLGISKLSEVMHTLTDTVAHLTVVTSFTFRWMELRSDEYLGPFFAAVWKAFGRRLQTLTLCCIPSETLATILPATEELASLRGLCVRLDCPLWGLPRTPTESSSIAVGTALAQLVNKVAPTLCDLDLSFWSRPGVLLSAFRQLRNIPNLERLTILCKTGMRVDGILDLIRFVSSHSATLRHVLWKVRAKGVMVFDFLGGKEFDNVFANLLTLYLSVPHGPRSERFGRAVECINRSAGTLTSLSIRDHYLTYDEVNRLVCIFAHRQIEPLLDLNIQVKSLSPELVLHLARTLPRLERLSLDFKHWTQDGVIVMDPSNKEEELVLARKFADAMRKCDFRDWSLRDIKLTSLCLFDTGMEVKLMDLAAECIPSVQTYGGFGKKDSLWRVGQPEGTYDTL